MKGEGRRALERDFSRVRPIRRVCTERLLTDPRPLSNPLGVFEAECAHLLTVHVVFEERRGDRRATAHGEREERAIGERIAIGEVEGIDVGDVAIAGQVRIEVGDRSVGASIGAGISCGRGDIAVHGCEARGWGTWGWRRGRRWLGRLVWGVRR